MNSSVILPTTQFEKRNECRQARSSLPHELLGEMDDDASSSLYQHISQCRSCLEAYIALQAAADLACPLKPGDT
ncbi:hypothetical protein Fuma_06012 [Fuerstiella marisgermanici]|uniref:Zinc-finger domain-containing protein n=1 Tax=Fuerstiella marisgermanici TaxID=1891926 RepID=A0A1P8WQM2_9PLAN|nr:hypothetical protein Fuma_06012 [Fuerstiella marisgermanici]